jgi:hypothetical protein
VLCWLQRAVPRHIIPLLEVHTREMCNFINVVDRVADLVFLLSLIYMHACMRCQPADADVDRYTHACMHAWNMYYRFASPLPECSMDGITAMRVRTLFQLSLKIHTLANRIGKVRARAGKRRRKLQKQATTDRARY